MTMGSLDRFDSMHSGLAQHFQQRRDRLNPVDGGNVASDQEGPKSCHGMTGFNSSLQFHTRFSVRAVNLCEDSGANVKKTTPGKIRKDASAAVVGQCRCGDVRVEIDFPARWAWHDHSAASRHAHGAAYATYVGSWRSRFRITQGVSSVTQFEDALAGTTRSFCARCGTPVAYERSRSPHMVNVPRALFKTRTGRQARYHIAIDETPEWAYLGEPLSPLKGFPGVVWDRSKRKPRVTPISVT
jgi:hypothetical protein